MNHDEQAEGSRKEKARSGSRNEKALANSSKAGGQSTGVTLPRKHKEHRLCGQLARQARSPDFQ